jgi:alpha-aminoadipic semialdehyde synthase
MKIGIRKETQYPSERRAALTPEHVKKIVNQGIEVIVESAEQRIFTSKEYIGSGAKISEMLEDCDVIFGVKEVPIEDLIQNKPFVFFSHTIKGQSYNMPLLQAILEKKITLMDYELVKGEDGLRIIFFGKFAGYAGVIDSLWLLGKRLNYEGIETPINKIMQATEYDMLDDAEEAIKQVGDEIKEKGLPDEVVPLITGFTGYGNVSKGAQQLYDLLPCVEIRPNELDDFIQNGKFSNKVVYKVEFKEEDMYSHPTEKEFTFNHFVNHPEEYSSLMNKYLPHLTMLVNGIYWEEKFPKHVTKKLIKQYYEEKSVQKLKVIGDITCDIEGSVEMTVKATSSKKPAYVYEPLTGEIKDGIEGNGPVILAVDKLPAELPRQASKTFGDALLPFVKDLAKADYSEDFENLDLPKEFKNAVIAHKGKLTPNFEYLSKFLQ